VIAESLGAAMFPFGFQVKRRFALFPWVSCPHSGSICFREERERTQKLM
jgi:hypothetical protein